MKHSGFCDPRHLLSNMLAGLAAAGVILCAASAHASAIKTEARNKLVIIVDASGTYAHRIREAVNKAGLLLDAMAASKVHRWQAADEVSIVSLDALPAVIWRGSTTELKAQTNSTWQERLAMRGDYKGCTDVVAAFNLAIEELGTEESRYLGKYIVAFSDLIHEPPTTSVNTCAQTVAVPEVGFPWEALSETSVTAFWVPANQTLAWRRSLEKHGLKSSFAVHSGSESAAVGLNPPPKKEVTITDEEKAETKDRMKSFSVTLLKWIGGSVGTAFLVVLGLAFGLRRRRHTRARPAPTFPNNTRPFPVRTPTQPDQPRTRHGGQR